MARSKLIKSFDLCRQRPRGIAVHPSNFVQIFENQTESALNFLPAWKSLDMSKA